MLTQGLGGGMRGVDSFQSPVIGLETEGFREYYLFTLYN